MAIHVACPLCHQQLELPDQFAGRTVRCRKCKDWFIAGSAPVVCHEALPPKSVGTRQSPKIRQPDLREQPTEPVRLKCPVCGKTLQIKGETVGQKTKCPACKTAFVAELETAVAERETPPKVPARENPLTNRWVIGLAAFCVLAAGILVGVLANRQKSELEQARIPDPVAVEPAPGQSAPATPTKQTEPPDPPLTEKQKAAAADAIKALGRIDAAVEVGVTYQQYGQLVIDAKAVVNEAERILNPTPAAPSSEHVVDGGGGVLKEKQQ